MDPREFAIPVNEIIPRLWLGNFNASKDKSFFQANRINVVFNCTKDLPFSGYAETQYRVPIDDNLEEAEIRNLALWSAEVAYKIANHYANGDRILVHCMAGMQRSAACIAIFLIMTNKWHTTDAIQFIRVKRTIAFYPKANFMKSIQHFDERFHNEILPAIQNKKINMNTI